MHRNGAVVPGSRCQGAWCRVAGAIVLGAVALGATMRVQLHQAPRNLAPGTREAAPRTQALAPCIWHPFPS